MATGVVGAVRPFTLLVAASCVGPMGGTSGDVLCVDPEAGAYASVQEAIDAAGPGGVVRVAGGIYRENLTLSAKRDLLLRGGYGAGCEARAGGSATTLEGEGGGPVIHIAGGRGITIEGFRITGGTGYSWGGYSNGGGIYKAPGARDVTIAGNEIFGNTTEGGWEGHGGGIASYGEGITVVDNWIHDNASGRGGGFATHPESDGLENVVVLQRNLIEDNVGMGDHGAGIELDGTSVQVDHNVVRGNRLDGDSGWGGGIFVVADTDAVLEWNVVTDNSAPTYGSALFVDEGARATLRHELYHANRCPQLGGAGIAADGNQEGDGSRVDIEDSTVAWNDCPDSDFGGNGLFVDGNSIVTFKNSIFWKNGGSDFWSEDGGRLSGTYSITEDVLTGTGNLAEDPLFVDPARGDFHVRSQAGRMDMSGNWVTDSATSPAIDRGDPSTSYADEPMPNGARANLGHTANSEEASKSN